MIEDEREKKAIDILRRHKPVDTTSPMCWCGWVSKGNPSWTWADHVARHLRNAGLFSDNESAIQCEDTHNPGMWPYVARCTREKGHEGPHRDKRDRFWLKK